MTDLRRVGAIALVGLVALRISIGWQFLYEGLWKLSTLDTPRPWSAEGYLRNAQGPFRDFFRNLSGDPDELNWLDYDKVAADWDAWHARFLAHYPDLTDGQKRRLHEFVNGQKAFAVPLSKLPEDAIPLMRRYERAIRYDPQKKLLLVSGEWHLQPNERDALLAAVDKEEHPEFHQALDRLYDQQAQLSFKERLAASLKGDPRRVTSVFEEHKGTIDYKHVGEIDLYKQYLADYEQNRAAAEQKFQFEHLQTQWAELQDLRRRLVGPVKALDAELKAEARKLLTPAQLTRGPVPPADTRIARVNSLTIWGLLGLGTLLILGLASRLAALGAAAMLLSFYLAMPPWPGVIDYQELPGPEHSFLIDKNMIEIVALLALAALPTGRWFGIDGILARLFQRLRGRAGRDVSKMAATPGTRRPEAASKSPAETKAPQKLVTSEQKQKPSG